MCCADAVTEKTLGKFDEGGASGAAHMLVVNVKTQHSGSYIEKYFFIMKNEELADVVKKYISELAKDFKLLPANAVKYSHLPTPCGEFL